MKPKPTPARRQGRPSVGPGEATKQITIRVPASLAKALKDFSRDEMRAALDRMVAEDRAIELERARKFEGERAARNAIKKAKGATK